MDSKAAPRALKIGVVQTITKYGIAVAIGLIVSRFFGDKGLWGISALAFIAAMSSTNGGLYTALTAEFGTKEEVGAIAILSIKDGPFLTMIALGSAGLASIPFMTLVGVILPLLVGVILGNLDPDLRTFLSKAGMVMIPFFAFGLGCGIKNKTSGTTPLQVATQLEELAEKALTTLSGVGDGGNVELRETLGDIRAQARLGQYYAAKIRGTVALGLYRKTGVRQHQKDAVAHLKNALTAWRNYAAELDASYTNKLFISGQRVFDWFDESGPQLDIAIAEKG